MESPEPGIPKPKTALDTVKDLNQLFFFVAFLLVGGAMGLQVLQGLLHSSARNTGVAVLSGESAEGPKSRPKVSYTEQFVAKLRDTYVFSLASNVIDPFHRHSKSLERGVMREDEPRGRYHAAGDAVNLIFVGPGGEGKVLFEQDVRINQYELSRDEQETPYGHHRLLLGRNLYLVTTSDTNKDGFLNYEDQQTLYVSEYNGADLKVVLEDVESYQELSANLLLITKRVGSKTEFFEYEVISGALREVKLPTLE